MKKVKLFLMSLFTIFIVTSCGSKENEVSFQILEMNDIHGHVEEESYYPGIAKAASLINDIREKDNLDNTILIGNGDMFQETALSRVSYGRVVVDAMNEMDFDMLGLGNHEFDWSLSTILNYFDGEDVNGEAKFPLVNSNVYQNNNVVSDTNIKESLIIEKEGVKFGILSYLGNVENSISKTMWEDYEFKTSNEEIVSSVSVLGEKLKQEGADVIIVNVHGGNSNGVEDYTLNRELAALKLNDEYLVNAVINGHTHTKQSGIIERSGDQGLPVVQSSGGLQSFGRIDLTYNKKTNDVSLVSVSHEEPNEHKSYDEKVKGVVETYYNNSKSILEELYCNNNSYISKTNSSLQNYVANLMMTSTSTEVAICNTGALRSNLKSGEIGFADIYALNPFDNHIITTTILGSQIKDFMQKNADREFCFTIDSKEVVDDKVYTLSIIDYVYYGIYFDDYRNEECIDTKLILRDLMIEDLRLRKDSGFTIETDYNNILIKKK